LPDPRRGVFEAVGMRIRQVKPGFCTDKVIAALPKPARLTYILLWMLADDYGWIEWDIEQAGAELYPFEGVKRRERELQTDLDALTNAGRIVAYDCGCLHIPHLAEHQRISGVRSSRAKDAHTKHLPLSDKQEPFTSSPGKVGVRVGNGRERNGTVDAREREDENGFGGRVQPFTEIIAGSKPVRGDA
jgi:hypothetical protein